MNAMHIKPQREIKEATIKKTVPMDTHNMHGMPERVSAQEKIAHRNMMMGCSKK